MQPSSNENQRIRVKVQICSFSDSQLTRLPFSFPPVECELTEKTILKLGRKVDKSENPTREEEYIAFRSKVVSRNHAEIWVGKDGQIYFKDVGSSSGTFLNRLRLAPSGKESRPYILKNGDIVQLGVDYQGRSEEIYKSVVFKIYLSIATGKKPLVNPLRLKMALRALISATNPNSQSPSDSSCTECCICLNNIAPLQALFLAPCSHCFHYKCIIPILNHGVMFQCPMCRQVANLDASVQCDEEEYENNVLDENDLWNKLIYLSKLTDSGTLEEIIQSSENQETNSIEAIEMVDTEMLHRAPTQNVRIIDNSESEINEQIQEPINGIESDDTRNIGGMIGVAFEEQNGLQETINTTVTPLSFINTSTKSIEDKSYPSPTCLETQGFLVLDDGLENEANDSATDDQFENVIKD